MSLRDQFAGSALRGLLNGVPPQNVEVPAVRERLASAAWDMADTMLEIRAQRYRKEETNGD